MPGGEATHYRPGDRNGLLRPMFHRNRTARPQVSCCTWSRKEQWYVRGVRRLLTANRTQVTAAVACNAAKLSSAVRENPAPGASGIAAVKDRGVRTDGKN